MVMRSHNGVCHICGQGAADAIDHIVPVAWGGSDDPSNLAPAHTSCNSAKGDAAPAQWTYSRPSMWLPGYGPRAEGGAAARASGGSGCWAIGGAVVAGMFASAFATSAGLPFWISLLIWVGVTWGLIRWINQRKRDKNSGISGASGTSGSLSEPPEIRMADGSLLRDGRGTMSLGGTAADTPPPGEQMEWLAFQPEGNNAHRLISEGLRLSPGFTGYRDGLVQPDGSRLVVNAMARLAADIAASGDEDATAAPVGFIAAGDWEQFPKLHDSITLVQVALTVEQDGSYSGRIGFRSSVGR
ncbi:MAG TPA: HNH endonuclease signature motif containing protein [Candidatus Nanopelagicales bacterium]|nr:HNH endonuclease signature motif containing protein [Candidatus Nanopelagicales bacterium]